MLLHERGAGDPLFLSALVAQLAAADDGPVVLVLDGLAGQLDRTTLDGLALLVERAGDTLRLVVTTRSDPPLPLARWRSLGWLNDLREDELRLTDDEALAIAATADTSIRDADAVVALNRRVDGWPIGLHMALLARPADDARSAGGPRGRLGSPARQLPGRRAAGSDDRGRARRRPVAVGARVVRSRPLRRAARCRRGRRRAPAARPGHVPLGRRPPGRVDALPRPVPRADGDGARLPRPGTAHRSPPARRAGLAVAR